MGKEFSEKPQIELVEEIERMQTETTNPAFEKKTMQVSHWRLLPLPAAVHAISLVDRANLGGLDVGNRFSLLSGLYFVLYIPFLLPSNFYARIFGVRLWLTICVISWGTVQLGEGFVKSWNQLLACRILLGAFEAGFFPPLVFIITTWYKRHEVQKRLAVFYLASIVIAGFSGIFSYGITFLHGKGGLGAWNWIFIIEGILTLVLGILTLLFAVGFPQSNKFLSEKETKFVLARVQEDRGDALADDMTVAKVLHHLCDWILWAYPLMYLSSTMPAYAIGCLNLFMTGTVASLTAMFRPFHLDSVERNGLQYTGLIASRDASLCEYNIQTGASVL
ncbi:putative transporter C11D3.18C [Mycena venus]|uniref:Putative transporter C11D3.18C n=1 Tax=Mycena venus TaxID=2733690 RepID=A0A8H6YNU9_9AGAR|nr:putative transporter C11D3.18C [Mycena venus]